MLMLSSGSGCSPMTSSPLISPRLWESRLTQLKYGGLQGLLAGVPVQDICDAGGWSMPLTFQVLRPGSASHSWLVYSLAIAVHSTHSVPRVPSGIPTRAMLHSWKLAPAAHHVLLGILVMMSPAPDVWPSILTDYTYDSELVNADGVPRSVSTQRLVPSGNQGYIRNLGRSL